MVKESLPTGQEILERSAAEIRDVRRVLQIAGSSLNADQREMVAMNYHFLVTGQRVPDSEYLEILQRCIQRNDFTELAVMFRSHYQMKVESDIAESTDTAAAPADTSGLENELRQVQSSAQTIRENVQNGGNSLSNIGTPALRHRPDWFKWMEQEEMSLDEVFGQVDGLTIAHTGDPVVLDIRTTTEGSVKSVA